MSQSSQEIFARLEAAVSGWTSELTGTGARVAEEIARIREFPAAPSIDLSALHSLTAALEAIQAKAARVDEALRECVRIAKDSDTRATQAEETLAEMRAEMLALEQRVQSGDRSSHGGGDVATHERVPDSEVLAEVQAFRKELARLREEMNQHPPATDTGGADDGLRLLVKAQTDELQRLKAMIEAQAPAPSLATHQWTSIQRELSRLRGEVHRLRNSGGATGEAIDELDSASEMETAPQIAVRRIVDLDLTGFDGDGRRRRMGEILRDAGALTQEQLDQAVSMQQEQPQRRLGSILTELGFVESDVIAQVLACQLKLPFVRLETETPEESAVRMINGRLAGHHRCVPIRASEDSILLAMANPLDLIAIEDVELATSRRVDPVVAGADDIAKAIEWYYSGNIEG